MTEHNVYIKAYYSDEVYENNIRSLLLHNTGNHLEDQITTIVDNVANLMEILVDKKILTPQEIAVACGISKETIYTDEGRMFCRTLKQNYKDPSKTTIEVVKIEPVKPLVSQYSEKLKETVMDKGTVSEIKAKWGNLSYVG
jgi:hypothetical protein